MNGLPPLSRALKGALLALLLLCAQERSTASPPRIIPRGYVCPRATGPITIDGVMNEPAWRAAAWTEDFVDIEGGAKPRPRFRTRARMLWNDEYLFIGAELREPQVWATLTRRDTVIFHDNDFEVFIDPNGDNLEYYELEMNALNTVWDLFLDRPYRDGGHARNAWDIEGLLTAVHVRGTLNYPADTDTGWTVEIAMPWKSLGEFAHRPAPPAVGDQWRINFSRVEWRVEVAGGTIRKIPATREDNWVWSPQGVVDMHQPEMWGYLQFGGAGARRSSFRPDPARPAEETLMAVYHAQVEFRKIHRRWAASVGELSLPAGVRTAFLRPPAVSLTSEGFIATVTTAMPGHARQTWFVTQDSRLWHE